MVEISEAGKVLVRVFGKEKCRLALLPEVTEYRKSETWGVGFWGSEIRIRLDQDRERAVVGVFKLGRFLPSVASWKFGRALESFQKESGFNVIWESELRKINNGKLE